MVGETLGKLLLSTVLLSSPAHKNKGYSNALEYLNSLPKEELRFDYHNLDFLLWERGGINLNYGKGAGFKYAGERFEKTGFEKGINALFSTAGEDNTSIKRDALFSYVHPPTIFDYGKNKIQYDEIKWKGLKVSDKVSVFFDEGLEDVGYAEANLLEKTLESYEKFFNHRLNKDIPMMVYNSYRFGQTNLIPYILPRSVGGFTETIKWVVVVPWKSNRFVKHVTPHEFSHVFLHEKELDSYWKAIKAWGADLPRVMPPTWIDEGFAEYLGTRDLPGGDDADMSSVMRDATVHGVSIPVYKIPYSYFLYKWGQSFLTYLSETYGEDKLTELIENWYSLYMDNLPDSTESKKSKEVDTTETIFGKEIKKEKKKLDYFKLKLHTTPMDVLNYAFKKTYGKDLIELDEDWRQSLKERYFREYSERDKLRDVSQRIIPERLSLSPVMNDKDFAYIGLGNGGLELKLVTEGEEGNYKIETIAKEFGKNVTFLHAFDRMDMNDDYLVFPATVDGRDKIFIYDLKNRKLESRAFKNIVEINSPTISFDSKYIAFVGLDEHGYYDIYTLNLENGKLERKTHDMFYERDLDFDVDSYDLVFASDKSSDGNYDIFLMHGLSGNVERLTGSMSDEYRPRFNPAGKVAFISNEDGIDNLFLLDEETGKVYRLTNLISPVKDVFWTNVNGNERLLLTCYDSFSYNTYLLKKLKVEELPMEGFEEGTWSYGSKEFDEKKFKRHFWFEGLGGGGNGYYLFLQAHLSDRLRDKHIFTGTLVRYRKILDSDFYLFYLDLSKRIPFLAGFQRNVLFSLPLNFTSGGGGKKLEVEKGVFAFSYPINMEERIENTLTLVNSNMDSKEFFENSIYSLFYPEEMLPEYGKGFRVWDALSFTMDDIIYSWKGPVEGKGLKLNLRTKLKPEVENPLTAASIEGDFRLYKKLGPAVLGLRLGLGFGGGEEFEEFGIGGPTTIKGYGWFMDPTFFFPQFFGKNYYLVNVELTQFPLIDAIVMGGHALPGIDMSLYINTGNVFDSRDKVPSPKVSTGAGFTIHTFGIPINLYFSYLWKEHRWSKQIFIGYNF